MTSKRRTLAAAVVLLLALVGGAAACGDDDGSGSASSSASGSASGSSSVSDTTPQTGGTLTLYNAQHESLATEWVDGFTEETGITVNVRSGGDFELANLLVQEGSSSPADVFITENSPAMTIVANAGLFAPIDATTLAQVPANLSSPDGDWMGIAARSTVLVYNTDKVTEGDLPASILDLAEPEWKGKVGMASAGADFQAIVSAVLALEGHDATEHWLKGLADNAKVYQGNGAVMSAVNDGEIEVGIIYHYYWYRDQAESGDNSNNTQLHYFGNQDPGAFLSVSGGGVLKSSKHAAEAQKLLAYITGKAGQQTLAASDALEYPVGNGIAAAPALKPLSELGYPDIDLSKLNGPETIELMQDAGLL